jgi:hypothetical protein
MCYVVFFLATYKELRFKIGKIFGRLEISFQILVFFFPKEIIEFVTLICQECEILHTKRLLPFVSIISCID